MRRPERGALLAAGLLLAGAALTGGVAVDRIGGTDVAVPQTQAQTPGLQFLSNEQYSRRYAEGPAGAVTPPALLAANERDSAYGSSLVVTVDGPTAPPGAPLLLGVAALLLALATVLRRPGRVLAAAGAGVLGATTLLVGLTGGGVVLLSVACALVVLGGLLTARAGAGAG